MITDGRLGTDNFARMLSVATERSDVKFSFNLPRLSTRLQEIAAESELHSYVVMFACEVAFANADAKKLPRGFGDLLDLMNEIGSGLQRGVQHEPCKTFLQSLKGSNKSAKAAKQLLSIETDFDARGCVETATIGRIERVGRWESRA